MREFIIGNVEAGHAAVGDALTDDVANHGIGGKPFAAAAGERGRTFTAEAIRTVTSCAANVESFASGIDSVGRCCVDKHESSEALGYMEGNLLSGLPADLFAVRRRTLLAVEVDAKLVCGRGGPSVDRAPRDAHDAVPDFGGAIDAGRRWQSLSSTRRRARMAS